MTKKIFRTIVSVVAIVLLLSLSVVTAVLYNQFEDTQESQLESELALAVQGVECSGSDYLESIDSADIRLTLIEADGDVLFDTSAQVSQMDNHADREEFVLAIKTGVGESSRYSDTLTEKMLYKAQKLSDGTVLRVAVSVDSVFSLLFDALMPIIIIFVVAVAVAIFIARKMAKSIVEPLNELDLENPIENETYEELSPMLRKLSSQHKKIDNQVKKLREKSDEIEQIVSAMKEGLVLLDNNGTVLSMNTASQSIFSVGNDKTGCNFLTVDRTPQMSNAVNLALKDGHSEFVGERNGRQYQFDISRIDSGSKTMGAVVLAFDITEKVYAERNRQEFTANVSHELKTPLQTIIGSAELLENGLVKPEDTGRFIGNIRKEASRLVSLINDIIRLSQLDEKSEIPTENVNLEEVAQEVFEVIYPLAKKRNITLLLDTQPCCIDGVRRYIYEIIYNLCDNAIRYNKDGGEVKVHIKNQVDNTLLEVSDTGIGIAPEHHARIFERFYRVDKSHSKETGGTGLGLSIVKHAVNFHNGKLSFDSVEGKGTSVKILF